MVLRPYHCSSDWGWLDAGTYKVISVINFEKIHPCSIFLSLLVSKVHSTSIYIEGHAKLRKTQMSFSLNMSGHHSLNFCLKVCLGLWLYPNHDLNLDLNIGLLLINPRINLEIFPCGYLDFIITSTMILNMSTKLTLTLILNF